MRNFTVKAAAELPRFFAALLKGIPKLPRKLLETVIQLSRKITALSFRQLWQKRRFQFTFFLILPFAAILFFFTFFLLYKFSSVDPLIFKYLSQSPQAIASEWLGDIKLTALRCRTVAWVTFMFSIA